MSISHWNWGHVGTVFLMKFVVMRFKCWKSNQGLRFSLSTSDQLFLSLNFWLSITSVNFRWESGYNRCCVRWKRVTIVVFLGKSFASSLSNLSTASANCWINWWSVKTDGNGRISAEWEFQRFEILTAVALFHNINWFEMMFQARQ